MIYATQNWKDAQEKQLRPEADVKIEFYTGGALTTLTYVTEINKANISNFSFRTSGKVENVNVPSVNINLELIKGTYSEIKRGYVAKLFYGFLINGSWEYIQVDYYRVTEVSIPANGLVDKFVLKMVSDDTLTKQYTKGSNGGNLDPIKFINKVYGYADYLEAKTDLTAFDNVLIGMSLGACSKIEALQVLAIACGRTLMIKGLVTFTYQEYSVLLSANNLFFKEITPDETNANYDYVISPNNSYTFPEHQNSMAVSNLVITEYTNTLGDVARTFNQVFTDFLTYDSWVKQFDVLYYKITYSVKAGTFSSQSVSLNGYTASWSALKSSNIARTEVYLYEMTTTAEQHTYTINSAGEDFYVDNELINENYLSYATNYLRAWLPFQDYIECDFRIDPRVELFDKIIVVDKSNHVNVVVVEEITVNFNSGFSGKIRGRVVETLSDLQPVYVEDYGDNEFDTISVRNPNDYKVRITVFLSTGSTQTYVIEANDYVTIWADDDNRPMQAEKGKMINGTLTQDVYMTTSMYDIPSVVNDTHVGIYFVLNPPVITRNTYNNTGQFAVDIYNPNNCDAKLRVAYSGGFLEFDVPAKSTISLTQANAGVLTDSAREKATGDLYDTVDCQFTHLYPYDPDYGEGYTQSSDWTIIWEADN